MDNSDLNFEYPPPDENQVDIERKIKTYLRKYSINFDKEKDIERYSDKYNESILINKEAIRNYLYSEMMSPEICDFYEFNMKNEVEEIDKENISDLEWDSEGEIDHCDSSMDGDYKIAGEDDEDSEVSVDEGDQKIDPQIVKILKDNNLEFMTPIQEKSIPLILNNHDILGISRTGTGKTLSYLIPIINNLLNINKSLYCLIISPTRELALQIDKNVQLFKNLGVRSLVLIGGEKIEDQISKLKNHPHIIIGTPGRIHKLGDNLQINRFRVLVLDEADKYFEDDFINEMKFILENLRKKRQTLFFTATSTENLKNKSLELLRNYKEIDLAVESKIEKLDEFYSFITRKYKESFLYKLLEFKKDKKIIVFVNMRSTANQISKLMKYMNIDNEGLNGDQIQEIRNEIINGFIKNKYNVLITTDVGSRGLDVCDVDTVINYDLPQNINDYVHRVGRTARAGKKGKAITLITQYDIPQIQKIENVLEKKLELFNFNENYKIFEDKIENLLIKINEELKIEKEETDKKPKKIKNN